MRGIVWCFDVEKGWGFIRSGKDDYFVHWSDVAERGYRTLHRGDEVSFDPCTTIKGLSAANVRRVI